MTRHLRIAVFALLSSPLLAAGSDINLAAGVTLAPGDFATMAVTLSSPAPPNGVYVNLTRTDPSVVTISPSLILINGGATAPLIVPRSRLRENRRDPTHHNNYGSYEIAKCVVEGIRANHLDLAKFLVDDVPHFDPAHPDPVDTWSIPASPGRATQAPRGN